MNESVIVIVSVLVSTLITYCFVSAKEIMQSRKRIELMQEMFDILNESLDKYKDMILLLAEEIDKIKEKEGKQKPTLRERYENIRKSEWFKRTHDGISVSDDEESKRINEDEMIRKSLMDFFDNANKVGENPMYEYGIHTDKILAWLKSLK